MGKKLKNFNFKMQSTIRYVHKAGQASVAKQFCKDVERYRAWFFFCSNVFMALGFDLEI